MAALKQKGDLAELRVAADLIERGCHLSFPYGEDCDYDLIADKDGVLHRIQIKYTESDGNVVCVRCQSHSLTNGRVRRTKHYTAKTIDWMAVYDRTSDRCYYCSAQELGEGRSYLSLRLAPARNGQRLRIRYASEYVDPDLDQNPRLELPRRSGTRSSTASSATSRSTGAPSRSPAARP